MGKLEYSLEAVNRRLREGNSKARVKPRGGSLCLQATLPPKPGSQRPKPYQQVISLGLPASEEGFRAAEQEALLLSARLIRREFDWSLYLREDLLPENRSVCNWIKLFKSHYIETHSLRESTWVNQYDKIYRRLPLDKPITAELLIELAQKPKRDTRDRQQTCLKLQKLADFMGLKVNLLQYKGCYGPSKVAERRLPADEEIAYWWGQIPNPAWRWAYGMMAAFGLRDHEVFFCEWTDEGLLVTQGKTGSRLVFQALYEEWLERWELVKVVRPQVRDVDRLYEAGKLGDKVARQFRRYKIPFTPYDLRHAFGIRASVTFEFPVTTAAALMGHSPDIHLKRYHKHIQLKHNQDAVRRIMKRPDRPIPPVASSPAELI